MAVATLNIRVTDLEPMRRFIEAVDAFTQAALRDGYTPPELDALWQALQELRDSAPPAAGEGEA